MKRCLLTFLLGAFLVITWAGISACSPRESGNLLDDVKQRGHFVIGVKYDSPPFGFMDADGQLQGFEIDLARELANRILGDSSAVRFLQVNTSTRVATLNAKQVDFILATMTITPDRAKIVNFTQPYYVAAQAVMVPEKSPYQHWEDLKDKRILYVIGGTGEANLKALLPTATILGFKTNMEAFSAFQAGRGDAFSTDDSILYGFLHKHCGVRLLEDRISEEPYGIAFRRDAASQPLQEEVQRVLDDLKAEGYLKALSDKWHKPYPPSDCPR